MKNLRSLFLITILLTPFFTFSQNVSYKKKKGFYAIIVNGKIQTDYQYTNVVPLKNDKLQVENESGFGLFDANGRNTLECVYDALEEDYFGNITMKKDGLIGKTDPQGAIVIPCEYSSIQPSGKDRYLVSQNDKYGVLSNGKLTVPAIYDALRPGSTDHFIAKKNLKTGIVDQFNNIALPFDYDGIDHYVLNEGGLVKYNGEWGVINADKEFSKPTGRIEYRNPDEAPRFKDCEEFANDPGKRKSCAERAMLEHLYGNIKYPVEARNNGIQGTSVISFLISPKGEIREGEVRKSIGGGCDEESLRVIHAMPNWIPGKVEGEPVWSRYILPVRFRLE